MTIPPLYDAPRKLAWDALQKIDRSPIFADLVLEDIFDSSPRLSPLDRAFILELVLGTLRWRGRLDAEIQRAAHSPGKKIHPRMINLLRLGAYQILFLDRVPAAAAVDETVKLARVLFRNERMTGFTNALLRAIGRNKGHEDFPSFERHPVENLIQAFSHPRWLVERWVNEYGPELAREICRANNQRPPLTVRANTLRISRQALEEKLQAVGFQCRTAPFSPEGLILEGGPSLRDEACFARGLYFVQDEASQIVSRLLDPRPGERILDACAAPGGKTTHMAQLMENRGEILALDLHGPRMNLLDDNCRRLGISIVKTHQADASQPLPFSGKLLFDRILVDAPCSLLGTLHRHPEVKWRRQPQDLLRLSRLQFQILRHMAPWLKPGGHLVYSTCTMAPEENEEVISSFLGEYQNFRMEDLGQAISPSLRTLVHPGGFFRTYPQGVIMGAQRMDGFFAARMSRS